MVFDVKIYLDLCEVCNLSNKEEVCGGILGVGMLATIGRFCICLYPHSHSKPTVLPPRLIFRHFLALHLIFSL